MIPEKPPRLKAQGACATGAVHTILVVDDSRAQRMVLAVALARWGYRVLQADQGRDALEICRREKVDLVLSDWVMPGMNGLEFCRAFRGLPREGYGYFILLTSKSEKEDVAQGLQVGADDFLTKPVALDELRARITAGERIVRMERELTEKNRLVEATLAKMQNLYDALDRDLVEARKLQQSLVKERHRNFGSAELTLLLRPSGHVGGDLVGFFPIGERSVGFYSIDVSGHGVASAIMTARLAGMLSGASPRQSIALTKRPDGGYDGTPPADVARRMNRVLLEEMRTDQYLTMLYAQADMVTGEVELVQAGHPHPIVQRRSGKIEFVGQGGMPVGLFDDARFENVRLRLAPGDRLFLMSDGITECTSPAGTELGETGLAQLVRNSAGLSAGAFLEALVWDLADYAGGGDFRDDVSGVLFEFSGA